jgi:hypothetical protein
LKASSIPPETRARIDEITRLIVEKILLTPTEQLKAAGDTESISTYTDALTKLFALDTAARGKTESTGRLKTDAASGDAEPAPPSDAESARPKVVEGPFNRSSSGKSGH